VYIYIVRKTFGGFVFQCFKKKNRIIVKQIASPVLCSESKIGRSPKRIKYIFIRYFFFIFRGLNPIQTILKRSIGWEILRKSEI